jgi:hypothetical protein
MTRHQLTFGLRGIPTDAVIRKVSFRSKSDSAQIEFVHNKRDGLLVISATPTQNGTTKTKNATVN